MFQGCLWLIIVACLGVIGGIIFVLL